VKKAGSIAIDVVRRVAGGKRLGLDRSFAARFARRLARKQRRNWRENGLRPRGRGYDWARTLVAEELLKRGADSGLIRTTIGELAAAVRCSDRVARLEIARLCRIDGFGRPAEPQNACVLRQASRSGPGGGVVLKVNRDELARRVLGRLKRASLCVRPSGKQLSLPLEEKTVIPAEIQDTIDRIARLAASRRQESAIASSSPPVRPLPADLNSRRNPDPFPHTPKSRNIHQVSSPPASLDRSASRPGVKIATRGPGLTVRPDKAALRTDWLEIAELDRTESETLSEKHRRRLMRHLRLACWNRGLDQVATRRVAGAIGWEAQRLRKASSRKYLIIDGVRWVLASSPAELRGATAHFLGMVKVVRGLSSGSDPHETHPG